MTRNSKRATTGLRKLDLIPIHSLRLMQEYYRAKDFFGNEQTKSAKERSKQMLDKDWIYVRMSMVRSFKNALLCKQCQGHHLKDEFEKKVQAWAEVLEKIDPNAVGREMLPGIKGVASWFRDQYLKKVQGTKCQGVRTVRQRQNVEENRERADSGTEMDLDVQEVGLDVLRMEL